MDKGIVQFQSLSRCEASQLNIAVNQAILNAYVVGLNVAANNYDKGLDDLFTAHRAGLESIGFGHISTMEALSMIVFGVKEEAE